jgi:hypothetical protein
VSDFPPRSAPTEAEGAIERDGIVSTSNELR